MRGKIKKSIYLIGSAILVSVLFLSFFLFNQDSNEVVLNGSTSESVQVDFSSTSSTIIPPFTTDSSGVGGENEDSGFGTSGSAGGGGNNADSGYGTSGDGMGTDGSGEGSGGDGSGDGGGGGGGQPKPDYWFRIKSEVSHLIYLRIYSQGDYNGRDFDEAPTYDYGDDLNPLYYYARHLSYSNYLSYDVEIELNNETRYLLPYYTVRELKNDVSLSPTHYKLQYIPYEYLYWNGLGVYPDQKLTEQEIAYSQYVKDTYLTIDESLKDQLLTLAYDNGVEESSSTLINDIAYYISHAAYYNLYAEEAPEGEDAILYFLTKSKEGVCRHYAAAATMMFRAFGIPARYTVGYALNTQAGSWIEWYGAGHAWVEIYLDGYGWVSVEVTGGEAPEPDDSSSDSSESGESWFSSDSEEEESSEDYSDSLEESSDSSMEDSSESEFEEKEYDYNLSTSPFPTGDGITLSVYSTKSEYIYLRSYSVGDYTGTGFLAPEAYDYGSQLNPLSYMANTLVNNGYISSALQIKLLQDVGYLQPYYSNTNQRVGTDVSIQLNQTDYRTSYMSYDFLSYGINGLSKNKSAAFVAQESAYCQYVYDYYTTIEKMYAQKLLALAEENGIYATSQTLIEDIAYYVQSAATYNLNFKPFPANKDVVLFFLTEGKEGICQHYAAAATMLYRAFGIPARYTVGFAFGAQAGEWVNVGAGHAWVEVYLDGYGWVAIEVTGPGGGGGGTMPPSDEEKPLDLHISISTTSASKVYDGTPLYNIEDVEVSGLPEGYTWEIFDYAKITDVGEYENIVYIIVYNPEEEPIFVKQSSNYGMLTIIPRVLTITTSSSTVQGDSTTVLTDETYTVDGLLEGHNLKLSVTGMQEGYGISDNTVDLSSIIILDDKGKDVTKNYYVIIKFGKLTVYP